MSASAGPPKPTRVPAGPALVWRRMAAITLGLGLGGSLACGGEEIVTTPAPVPQPPAPATDGGSADAPQPLDVAERLDVEQPPLDSGNDEGGLADVVVDKHDVFEPPCGVK